MKSNKKVILIKGEHGNGKSYCLKRFLEKHKMRSSKNLSKNVEYIYLKSLDKQ
jgi:hypothetical protein